MVELRLEFKPSYAKCHDLSTQMSEQIRPVLGPLLGPSWEPWAEIRATGLPVLGGGRAGARWADNDEEHRLVSALKEHPAWRRVEVPCQTRQRQGSIEADGQNFRSPSWRMG